MGGRSAGAALGLTALISCSNGQNLQAAGAIAMAYNLPDCTLKLSQAQLVQIFVGKIKNFQELGCADQPIQVVMCSDGSGTTYNFTNSLAAFSPSWKKGPGVGKSVNWP